MRDLLPHNRPRVTPDVQYRTTRQHGDLFRPEIYKNERRDLRTGCSTGRNMMPRPDMKEAATEAALKKLVKRQIGLSQQIQIRQSFN